jgi:RimJ/RimL family protein N-acetyltransferase
MKFTNWKIDRPNDIRSDEFYELIRSNANRIGKTFPVTVAACSDLKQTSEFISDAIEKEKNGEGYYFYLRNLESAKLIGYVCIKKIDLKIRKCELAYFVDVDFEGQGITTEAICRVIDFCFSELNMNKINICTSLDNIGSQRIATKHGFQQEGTLREEFKNGDGILEDINYYGLLKSEYNER